MWYFVGPRTGHSPCLPQQSTSWRRQLSPSSDTAARRCEMFLTLPRLEVFLCDSRDGKTQANREASREKRPPDLTRVQNAIASIHITTRILMVTQSRSW